MVFLLSFTNSYNTFQASEREGIETINNKIIETGNLNSFKLSSQHSAWVNKPRLILKTPHCGPKWDGGKGTWGRIKTGKALGKAKTEQSKKPELCFVPSAPHQFFFSFFLVLFQWLILGPIRHLTINSPPTSNHIHKSQGMSLVARRGTSKLKWTLQLGTRQEKFSWDRKKGPGEVKESGGKEAGRTKDCSQAPKLSTSGREAIPVDQRSC